MSRLFSLRGMVLSAVLMAAAGPAARGQVLADRVPADALFYAGWAGSDALGPAYDGSHLKAFLESMNLPALIGGWVQQGLAQVPNPEVLVVMKILTAVAKSPTAVYVGPVDVSNPAQLVPHVAIISNVGKVQAAELAQSLGDLILNTRRPPNLPPVKAAAVGEFLVFTVGDVDLADRLTGAVPEQSLAKLDTFQKTVAHLKGEAGAAGGVNPEKAAVFAYVDAQAIVQTLTAAAQAGPNAQVRQYYAPVIDGLGLNGVLQYAWAGNFDGKDWAGSSYLAMRDRRNGLLAFFDNPPLSQESLKLVPKSAVTAGAVRFDGMRLLADLTVAAGKINDDAPKQLETVLTQAYVWTGIDLKRELFPGFGNEYMYYGTPEATGSAIHGFTMVNRLRDAVKAQSAAEAIENYVNLLIAQRDPNTKIQFKTQPLPAPWDKVTAHYVALEQATPAWAINNGVFYFSLSLPGLQSALEMGTGNKESILDNPQFVALRNKLTGGPRGVGMSSFSYADLAKSAPETYQLLNTGITQALARNAGGGGGGGGPAFTLPPLDKITPTLGPTLKIYWSDAAGLHGRETSPFPMAGYLTPTQWLPLLLAQRYNQQRAQQAVNEPATRPGAPGGLP